MQKEIQSAEHEQEQFKKVQLHEELGQQMREQKAKQNAERMERKDKVCTTGGPTMEVEDVEALRKKLSDQKKLVKLNLQKQDDMDKQERKVKRQIEIDQEKMDAERIAAKHMEAKQHKKKQKEEALNHFKAVWDAQKELKNRNESMENCFK